MENVVEELFSFGGWIRRRRRALDLTQAALAQRVGCAEVTIRKLEADVFRPSPEIAERLAIYLDIPPADRAVFLQVARAERRVDQLSPPTIQIDLVVPPTAPQAIEKVQIPLDRVPEPASLPPGSRMPLSRNPLFVGREDDLRNLARALNIGGTAAIGQMEIAAATGLGGIGKTQLACEFAHRYGQFFSGGVFWLSFADPAAIPGEVMACGGADGMQLSREFGMLPHDEQVRQVLAAWESPTPRLLIFDNCEDELLLDEWRPKYGGCRVLITSRRQQWDPALGVHPLPLDVLPRRESLVLLHQFRPDLPADNNDLAAIAEALGDLPLALHLAGSFLARYRRAITPAHYLQRLRSPTLLDDRSLQAAGLSPTKHVQHVARTFEQSYERLDPADTTDGLALKLLTRVACFAPGEPLPYWLLRQTLTLADDPDTDLLVEEALTRVIDLGLMQTNDEGVLSLHRLLVAFVQTVGVDADSQTAVESSLLRLADYLNTTGDPRPLLALQPHLRFITDRAQQREDAHAARLCSAFSLHLRILGAYPEARSYLERALAIHERLFGLEHAETARSLTDLSRVVLMQGEYGEARAALERALAIQERLFGLEHPDTVRSLHGLGVVLLMQGEYGEARAALERALAIRERVLVSERIPTAWNLDGLGVVLRVQGEHAAARDCHQRALAIREQVFEPGHPDTMWSLHYLGEVLHDQGEYAAARAALEQALAIQERVLGPEHPETARTLSRLGKVLHGQGDVTGAREYLERALLIQERVLGVSHPDPAYSLDNLGLVLREQGQYAEAQSYHERALAIRQRVLGADHPDTAYSMHSLGELLHIRGDAAQARPLLERALIIFEQRLGPQHPDTRQTRRILMSLHVRHTAADPE